MIRGSKQTHVSRGEIEYLLHTVVFQKRLQFLWNPWSSFMKTTSFNATRRGKNTERKFCLGDIFDSRFSFITTRPSPQAHSIVFHNVFQLVLADPSGSAPNARRLYVFVTFCFYPRVRRISQNISRHSKRFKQHFCHVLLRLKNRNLFCHSLLSRKIVCFFLSNTRLYAHAKLPSNLWAKWLFCVRA